MERPASQNHLEAFSADTTDIPSPQKTGTLLQKLHHIFQETSSLYISLNNENKSVLMFLWREPFHQGLLVSQVRA